MSASPDPRSALLRILVAHSFRLGDFTLASGQKSDYYIDCRTTTLHAEGGRLAGVLLHELIRQHMPEACAVGGLTMGADPLVSNIATASALFAVNAGLDPSDPGIHLIHGFLVRKSEKTHGTVRRIEGFLTAGAPVVIVDDVCTTGGSTITAMEAAREAGMRVIGVLCLVDRQQGGRARIEAAAEGAPFLSLFTADDVRNVHIDLHSTRPSA